MKRTSTADFPCSIARALDAAGEWWAPLILRDVAYGVRRFAEIEADLGMSANVLSDRLQRLVAEGLLQTRSYQERPPRHEYRLTEKGLELIPVLLALMQWGDRWCWTPEGGPVSVVHDGCGHEVSVEVRCPECERAVAPGELRARPSGRLARPPRRGQPGHISARALHGDGEGAVLSL